MKVFTAERVSPGVLSKPTLAAQPTSASAMRQLRAAMDRNRDERKQILLALDQALDGWEDRASAEDAATIAQLRSRWGLTKSDPTPDAP